MKETYTEEEYRKLYEHRERFHLSTLSGKTRHEQLFEPYGVSPTEFRTLSFLVWNPVGSEPSVIADSLMILRQTMTKVIDSLESKGLAERTLHPKDRRRVYVRLLPAGVELAKKLLELETDYSEAVESHFTPEELENFRRLFWKMQNAREEELRRILEERAAGKTSNEG